MATFTATWLELVDILKAKEHRSVNFSERYVMTVYCVDDTGDGVEYKVVGDNDIMVTPVKDLRIDRPGSKLTTLDQIWNTF